MILDCEMCSECLDNYAFQQDGPPACQACENVELLTKEAPYFISPYL